MVFLVDDAFYTPATVERLLLNSDQLIRESRQIVNPESGPTNSSNPQGGFETGVTILVDLHAALAELAPFLNQVVQLNFVDGFFVYEVAEKLHCRRSRVRQAKEDGILQMAHFLGWVGVDDRLEHRAQRERWRLEVASDLARLMGFCPKRGLGEERCPVCGTGFDAAGDHDGFLYGRTA